MTTWSEERKKMDEAAAEAKTELKEWIASRARNDPDGITLSVIGTWMQKHKQAAGWKRLAKVIVEVASE